MMTILLYGFLGRQFGKVHNYDVRTPAEAVRALRVTLPGFRKALIDGGAYRVLLGGKCAIDKEQLQDPVSDRETIRIVPVIFGAGGVAKAILGVVLIVVGTYFGQGWMVNVGISLALGGVSEMLFAKNANDPTNVERPENRPSFVFDGAVNTAAQGNPVSLLYGGPLLVGSQVISAGLATEEIA